MSSNRINIIHLSDLHFGTEDNAKIWSGQLAEDVDELKSKFSHIDVVILSGDIANRSTPPEYKAAKIFVDNIKEEFNLEPNQIIIVPGNHDLNWDLAKESYNELQDRPTFPGKNHIIKTETVKDILSSMMALLNRSVVVERYFIRDDKKYKDRFQHFSKFYEDIKGEPYPLEYEDQGILHYYESRKLLILGLNSAWELDHHYKTRAEINENAINKALKTIRNNPTYQDCLKIAVWHHPLHSSFEDRIKDHGLIQTLARSGFRLALHGHIHKVMVKIICASYYCL